MKKAIVLRNLLLLREMLIISRVMHVPTVYYLLWPFHGAFGGNSLSYRKLSPDSHCF